MTKEQILALDMALNLAAYFVEEHQDDKHCPYKGEQWHTDNERVKLARSILREVEAAK
jgi:hypothetical protein